MSMTNILVDLALRNAILSFMDGHLGYNQIFVAKDDVKKTTLRCLRLLGTYEWVVMPFGLKNASAAYQKAMNSIFYDMINLFIKVNVDDMIVKSPVVSNHFNHLMMAFE